MVAGDPHAETTQPDKETPVVEPKSVLHAKSLLGDSERFDGTLQMIDSEMGITADFVAPPKEVFSEVAINAKSNPLKKLPADETMGSKISKNLHLRDDIGLQKDNGPSHMVASSAKNMRPLLVDISNTSGPKVCVDGCPFARYFHEDNISTYEKISRFETPYEIKEMLKSCSLEEGQNLIGQLLADVEAIVLNLELCNPGKFLEVYDCLGEQCEFHKYFDTEGGLAKLAAIVNLKTKKFFLSNFRRAREKRATRVSAWYKEAERASSLLAPAYEEDKAAFNIVKEAMGADWVKNEFHSFVIQMASK
ncbi:hypothetical protein CMV_010014 [Castanea mollissima]|uniref:Uncharacterized protein n=1 Tax=Castanea mollissima TaxID=60419 RepID=A0A8J4RDE5_9ROSI|nr:hypothetical protein CMV_010014 [Castanea mollissima]